MNILAVNRRATFDYEILESHEAGIQLFGFEVKAIRAGRANLAGSFVVVKNSTAVLLNADIPPYQVKNTPPDYDALRSRKLLLHKSEIRALIGQSAQRGLTLVPLRIYSKGQRIKLEFGLARHKKKYDKREKIREREDKRKIGRALKE